MDFETERALETLAKRTRRSRSDIAREAIARHVRAHDEAYLAEARRQSLQVSAHDDREFRDFMEAIEAEDGEWHKAR